MKKRMIFPIMLAGLCLCFSNSPAQQAPFSDLKIFLRGYQNPAILAESPLHELRLAHQQQSTGASDWKAASQLLHYQSPAAGKSRQFGWGLMLSHDRAHTERRIAVSPSVGVNLIHTDTWLATVGISAGILQWSSSYNKIPIYDEGDPILASGRNFLELDAGVGGRIRYRSANLRGNLELSTTQLAGNLISGPLPAMRLRPQMSGSGGILLKTAFNCFAGPRFGIRQKATDLTKPIVDLGVKVLFPRQKMWLGGSYRTEQTSLQTGFGVRILAADTARNPEKFAWLLDLNGGFSFPLESGNGLGPTLELGVAIVFGTPRQAIVEEILRPAKPIWKSDGNLNEHKDRFLAANGPEGLKASTNIHGERVRLQYVFSDNSYLFSGDAPIFTQDTLLREIGEEWLGVDDLLQNISQEVIPEALSPDPEGILDPENLEPLQSLLSIELSANLIWDETGATNGVEGIIYEGEFGTNNPTEDTLFIKVVYDESDTLAGIPQGRYLTNLELSCLKLHAMRKRLQHALTKRYGTDWAILWEGQPIDYDALGGRRPVFIRKLRIASNNPNQGAFLVNQIVLKFSRVVKEEDDGFVPREEWDEEKKEGRKK